VLRSEGFSCSPAIPVVGTPFAEAGCGSTGAYTRSNAFRSPLGIAGNTTVPTYAELYSGTGLPYI
jgi:hypothetical protein